MVLGELGKNAAEYFRVGSNEILLKKSDFLNGILKQLTRMLSIFVIQIEWDTEKTIENSVRLLYNLYTENQYETVSMVFTTGTYSISLVKTNEQWEMLEEVGCTDNVTFDVLLSNIVKRNMYIHMLFYSRNNLTHGRKSIRDRIPLSELIELSKDVDSNIKFIGLPVDLNFWRCEKCNSSNQLVKYECSNCCTINWTIFYQVKSEEKPTMNLSRSLRQVPPEQADFKQEGLLSPRLKRIVKGPRQSHSKNLSSVQSEPIPPSASDISRRLRVPIANIDYVPRAIESDRNWICQGCSSLNTVSTKFCWKCSSSNMEFS